MFYDTKRNSAIHSLRESVSEYTITNKQNSISCERRPIILKLTKLVMIIKFV